MSSKITPAMIKELRERTQAGMSDCKAALEEEGGDLDKAVENILKKGIVKAAARAGKVATEGEVRTVVTESGTRDCIVPNASSLHAPGTATNAAQVPVNTDKMVS